MKSLPEITDKVKKNLIWKSIFRRDYRNTVRDRAQAVFGNVFLHLHPVQVRESAVKLRFTWGMGGITFFAYILLIITGVVLMFYYHPSIDQAYTDIKDLEFQVPFGVILRNLHRWGAHFMVIVVMIHMFRVFMTGSYKAPPSIQLGCRCYSACSNLSFEFYRLSYSLGSAWVLGHHCWHKYGRSYTASRLSRPIQ